MKKVLSIGEATLDSFVFLSEANVHCSIDNTRCDLKLRLGDKILADNVVFSVGGNAANTAVSFSRLGMHSQLYSIRGDDWLGKRIQEVLEKEKIDCKYIDVEPGPSSYATGIVFHGERSQIIYHVPHHYHLPKFELVDWVYLTSMGKAFMEAYGSALQFVKENKIKVSFNPGSFQLKAGVTALKPFFAVTEALFVNKEEAQLLTELSASASIKDLSEALYELGPKIINITDGPRGAYSFDGHQLLFLDIFPAEVVERTGAGDSYAAGFTAALIHGETIGEAMRWGMANSASVIASIGPEDGLLTKDQMIEALNDHPHILPTVQR